MFLSPIEQAYLNGTRQFTKPQQRYIRYRLNKKLRLLSEELTSFGIPKEDLESRDAAAARLLRLDNARPQGYETERSLLLRETIEKKPAALVAQPAERRFRNPSLHYYSERRGGDLRPWVQIPSRAFIFISLLIIISIFKTQPRSARLSY
jgi:hypothetical protein